MDRKSFLKRAVLATVGIGAISKALSEIPKKESVPGIDGESFKLKLNKDWYNRDTLSVPFYIGDIIVPIRKDWTVTIPVEEVFYVYKIDDENKFYDIFSVVNAKKNYSRISFQNAHKQYVKICSATLIDE